LLPSARFHSWLLWSGSSSELCTHGSR